MAIIGIVIAIIILIVSFVIAGPYGIGVFFIVLFGLVFSTHQKNKQILEELKTIREKFGLLREDEKIQIEIDKSIEEYNIAKEDPQKISELDKEIEEELEKYLINNKDMEDKNNKEDKKE